MKTLPIALATVLASSLAGAAHATTSAGEVRRQVVNFADLDLNQDTGAERLYRRIRTAAHDVCWTPGVLTILMGPKMEACEEQAIARAIANVNTPSLTRYYVAQGGTPYRGAGRYRSALVQGGARESNRND